MNRMMPKDRPATYQDVLDAPENMVAEIVDGRLYLQPRPRPSHGRTASGLSYDLLGPFDRGVGGPGGWIIIDKPELHLNGAVLVPDIAAWRRERLDIDWDVVGIAIPPDWVCEVFSPTTRVHDLTRKRDAYGCAGVAHLWFVDPEARLLEAFTLVGGAWQLTGSFANRDTVRAAPFEAVGIELANLWAPGSDSEGDDSDAPDPEDA